MGQMDKVTQIIREQIINSTPGTLFAIGDFTKDFTYENAKKSLQRIAKQEIIDKVVDGIYVKPQYSKLLNKKVNVSIKSIIEKIAYKNSWEITPTGNTALNILKLSTQVPGKYEYLTDGPTRKYIINNQEITLKKTNNRNIKNMSYESRLVVQALKTLGEGNISAEVLNIIKNDFPDDIIHKIKDETIHVSPWIYEYIKRI